MTYRKEFFLLGLMLIWINITPAQTDIQTITNRLIQTLISSDINDTEITQLLESINENGTWPGINYENVSNEGFEHRVHYSNMLKLARAYKKKESGHFKKKKVKEAIELALRHWVENDYICDNWWYNQIGTPDNLVKVLLLVGKELDEDLVAKAQPIIGRAHVEAPGARPGGDRIKIASIQAKNALFNEDAETFNKIIRIIEGEIKFSKWIGAEYGYGYRNIRGGFSNRDMAGRGIQHDYSFHHRTDGVNNTLSYGLGYAAAFAEWAMYTRDTEFAFSDERLEPLIDYFLDGICKTAVFGKFPDPGAKNRSISRRGTLKPYNAGLAQKLMMTSDYRKEELQEIIDIRTKSVKPILSHATYYWHSEHFSFQRPDWFASVRMYSTRTHNMEVPYNSEGLLNHHRGDGANHVSVGKNEYLDIWPVFDYQKIPGATILQKPQLPAPREIQKLGSTDFVGAATDGMYGAVGFDFRSAHDPLIARKSWFFFDDQYVCLGAGISSKNRDLSVASTLNQTHLRGEVLIHSRGHTFSLEKGMHDLEAINWVYHDQLAYVFPKPSEIRLKNQESLGSWYRINQQTDSPKDEVKMDVFTLWLDHGVRPSDSSYEYIVIPAVSKERVQEKIDSQDITILSNTPQLQAVADTGLNLYQAVFYEAGEIFLNDVVSIISHNAGIVICQISPEGKYKLTVSDPNREQSTLHLSINKRIESSGEGFSAFWNEKDQLSELLIDLPKGQYRGSSVTIEF